MVTFHHIFKVVATAEQLFIESDHGHVQEVPENGYTKGLQTDPIPSETGEIQPTEQPESRENGTHGYESDAYAQSAFAPPSRR